jgi:ribosomal protein L21E
MSKRKKVRGRGKIKLSEYFKELKEGDRVSIVREQSLQPSFPKRIQGKSGVIETKRGKSFIVKLSDQNKEKRFIIEAIHLKKLGGLKK